MFVPGALRQPFRQSKGLFRLKEYLIQPARRLATGRFELFRSLFIITCAALYFGPGYGVKTIPAVREAIEQRKWPEVEPNIVRIANLLQKFSQHLDTATTLLKL